MVRCRSCLFCCTALSYYILLVFLLFASFPYGKIHGCALVSHLQGTLHGVFQSHQLTLTFCVPAGCMNCRPPYQQQVLPSIYYKDAGGQEKPPPTQCVLPTPWKVSSFLAISQQKAGGQRHSLGMTVVSPGGAVIVTGMFTVVVLSRGG